jgi:HSP20 family protein
MREETTMTLYWNPYQAVEATRPWRFDGGDCECAYAPRVDVVQDANGFELAVELPGLEKSDVKIEVENGVLRVTGERKFPGNNGHTYLRVEGDYGTFERSFELADSVDTGKISATMDKGILHVALPRREETKPRQIEVAVQ